MESNRKYKSDYRLNLMNKIKKIQDKEILKKIYKLVKSELKSAITKNSNGIFFNLNLLSDETIEKIDKTITNIEVSESYLNITYTPYSVDDLLNNSVGPRLNNHERNLLKKKKSDK